MLPYEGQYTIGICDYDIDTSKLNPIVEFIFHCIYNDLKKFFKVVANAEYFET